MTTETSAGNFRVFTQNPEAFFQQGFTEIAHTRMKGLPIVHPGLEVKVIKFRRWQNDWIGMVVTPWSILSIYVCGNRQAWQPIEPGRVRTIELPSGDYPYTCVDDQILGRYLTLSLKSPVLDFENQQAAELFAGVALDAMLTATSIPNDDEDATVYVPPTADGQLRRVIPIKVNTPKNIDATPRLTPEPPKPEPNDEAFFDRKVSRRALFGRSPRPEGRSARAQVAAADRAPTPATTDTTRASMPTDSKSTETAYE